MHPVKLFDKMSIQEYIRLSDAAKEKAADYPMKRDLFHDLDRIRGRHFTGIIGPRGVGKTIILQQIASQSSDAFYLSADTLDSNEDIFDLIRRLSEQFKYRLFLLDEIHHVANVAALLKKLYDFLNVRVLFTSSVALSIQASMHDLARRVRLATLRSFSYREYIRFIRGTEYPPLLLSDLLDGRWSPEHLRAGGYFDEYLRGGNLPFAMEDPDPLPLLRNILDKIIARDVPSVLRLMVHELEILKRMLAFIGRSSVDGVNYSSISRNVGITKYKAVQYVNCMEQAFVLRQIFPAGTNVLREPKILMMPPYRLLYRDWNDALGGLREDFCVESLTQIGCDVLYLKSKRGAKTPDFIVNIKGRKIAIEIGGRGKGREQFKGVVADRKLVFAHNDALEKGRLPLFLLGLVE